MSRARDDRRRNMRAAFATTREDGTPVGSSVVTYADYCALAFNGYGQVIAGSVGGPDHEPGSHVPANAIMRGPYRFDSFDERGDEDYS